MKAIQRWAKNARHRTRMPGGKSAFDFACVAAHVCIRRRRDEASKTHYVLNYPAADTFFVPVRDYAQDVVETVMEVNGGLVEHVPNGGYALAIVTKVQGQNLLHLGADVAWLRPGRTCVRDRQRCSTPFTGNGSRQEAEAKSASRGQWCHSGAT